MKRNTFIFLVTICAILAALTLPVGGRRIVGFNYRAVLDTEFTVCPDRVVAQSGDLITLATGEQFKVHGATPEHIAAELLQCNSYVRVDRQERLIEVRNRCAPCAFRPERRQWITIPLRAKETVRTHVGRYLGDVEAVMAADLTSRSNPTAD